MKLVVSIHETLRTTFEVVAKPLALTSLGAAVSFYRQPRVVIDDRECLGRLW